MRNVVASLLLLFAAAACGTSKGPVEIAKPADASTSWERVRDEHTRRNQSYLLPTLEVDVRATLVTPRLRSAFIASREKFSGRIADDFEAEFVALGKKPDEGMDRPMKKGILSEEHVLVFASLFIRDAKYRDLSTKASIWDVSLIRGDARVLATEIDRVKVTPGLAALFPYVDRFDEAYFFRFPLIDAASGTPLLSPGGAPLTLEVKSAIGTARLEWTLKGDGVTMTADDVRESTDLPDRKTRPALDDGNVDDGKVDADSVNDGSVDADSVDDGVVDDGKVDDAVGRDSEIAAPAP